MLEAIKVSGGMACEVKLPPQLMNESLFGLKICISADSCRLMPSQTLSLDLSCLGPLLRGTST